MKPSHVPSLDALRETHRFPCPYTFKAFGPPGEVFAAKIESHIARANGGRGPARMSQRASSGGKWNCVTAVVVVDTPEIVQAIYLELLGIETLRMLL